MFLNLFLIFVGILSAVHFISTATALSPKAPVTMSAEVVVGFASSVGVVVTAIHNDSAKTLLFCGVLFLALLLLALEKSYRGAAVLAAISSDFGFIRGNQTVPNRPRK